MKSRLDTIEKLADNRSAKHFRSAAWRVDERLRHSQNRADHAQIAPRIRDSKPVASREK